MRLIDADALVEAIKDYPYGFRGMIVCDIAKQPTIDAVPVVRCKDCKHRDTETGLCEGRGWPMQLVPDDGFCDKGERREDDQKAD